MTTQKTAAMWGLGKVLRTYYDGIASEPLPPRWSDLIRGLDNKARRRAAAEPVNGHELRSVTGREVSATMEPRASAVGQYNPCGSVCR